MPKVASCPRSYGLPRSEELRKEGGGETSSISLTHRCWQPGLCPSAPPDGGASRNETAAGFCVSWHWHFLKPREEQLSRATVVVVDEEWQAAHLGPSPEVARCPGPALMSEVLLVQEQSSTKNAISSNRAFKILCLVNRQPSVSRPEKRIQSCTLIPATAVERRPGER